MSEHDMRKKHTILKYARINTVSLLPSPRWWLPNGTKAKGLGKTWEAKIIGTCLSSVSSSSISGPFSSTLCPLCSLPLLERYMNPRPIRKCLPCGYVEASL